MTFESPHRLRSTSYLAAGLAASIAIVFFASALCAQIWTRTPSEWTPQEAKIMLVQSPWAKLAKLQTGMDQAGSTPGNRDNASQPSLGTGSIRQYEREKVLGNTATPVQDTFFMDTGPKFIPLAELGAKSVQDDFFGSKKLPAYLNKTPPPGAPRVEGISMADDAVIVLWDSAAPVQEAKAKLGVKDGIKDRLARYFVVSVVGYPFRLDADRATPAMRQILLDSAKLVRKDKKESKAVDLHVTQVGENVILRFFFSRTKPIEEKDKEITFRFQFGPTLVETKFTLKEMNYEGKLAL